MRIFRAIALIGASVVTLSAQASVPDLLLYNGHVITVDRSDSITEAVAIKGDAIVAVGTNRAIRPLASSSTRVIDLKGATVLPGLMDNHLHGAGGGAGVDLSRTRSLSEVLSAVAARVKTTAPGDVVVSNTDWHEAQLKEQRLPLRDDLDAVAATTPVVLVRGGHEYIVNSAALARWKITEQTPEPPGGRISRYRDGRLNGELVDRAKDLVSLPRPRARTREERMQDRMADYNKLHAAGLTTVRHPGMSLDDYRLLQEMQKRGVLTMRVHALLRGVKDLSGVRLDEGDDRLRLSGIKLAVDGGFEGGLMRELYQRPFDERETFRGLQTVDTTVFIDNVRDLNQRGWRVATHAVGDAAIDLVLKAYETANAERSIAGRRWTIEHAFIGRPDHLPRIKALDVAISAQNHLYLAGPSLVKYWGSDRAALTTPVRRYLEAGLLVSSGSDAPVVPYPPLWTLYHFITRDTLTGGVMGRDQRVTRMEAIRLATINNARLMGDDARKGSLEIGKLADLVVISENILTCPEARIRDAEVRLTIVGGKIVYETTNTTPTAARPGHGATGAR
jgi:predicted amidohydrolase YtcJ